MDSGAFPPSHPYHSRLRNGEIRLLHLYPGRETQPLTGRLQVVRLSQTPSFEALSYEWGLPDKSKQFSTTDGGFIIHITASLYQALRDLCPEMTQGPRILWADSICINQEDIEERQDQVAIMGDIYRLATQVITYIGPERPFSAAAIQMASKLAHLEHSPGDSFDALEQAGFPPSNDPRWYELKSLCLRSWVRSRTNFQSFR